MLKKITEKVYYMEPDNETDRPALGLVVGDEYSLIVDSGNSQKHAREFLSEIEKLNVSPVKYLVLTHYHWDHVFGINEMNLTTIAQENITGHLIDLQQQKWDDASLDECLKSGKYTDFAIKCFKAELENRDEFTVGKVDITFKEKLEIDLGNTTCIIEAVAGDHTKDSAIVYVPEEKVMFLGDCTYGGMFNRVYGYTREALYPMMDKILQYDAEYYVISHEELNDKVDIQEFWEDIKLSGDLIADDTHVEGGIRRMQDTLNRKPTEDETIFMKWFADVNKERKENM